MASASKGHSVSGDDGQNDRVPKVDSDRETERDFRRQEWDRIHHRRHVAFELTPESSPEHPQPLDASADNERRVEEGDLRNSDFEDSDIEASGSHGELKSERPKASGPPKDLVGLSLSGGGLRSAMFNDGFLQGISHRGLLRYVDYLCSVSGGGYIASHLVTRTADDGKENFHADEDDKTDEGSRNCFLPWHLGRHPNTGAVDETRMAGVGQYLSNPLHAALCYTTGLLTNALVYLGLLGIVASLIAIMYRSFDLPDFRYFYFNVFQFGMGNEFTIAFIPTLIILAAWACAMLVWMTLTVFVRTVEKYVSEQRKPAILLRIAMKVLSIFGWSHKIFLMSVFVSALIGLAVFLGNDVTQYRQGVTGLADQIHLNRFAQYLALAAAVIQIIAFLGRERLFRSEKDEAQHWHQAAQKTSTFGVLALVVFAMIHWMAQENISGYSQRRSQYLVAGDVQDWTKLRAVFESARTFSHPSDQGEEQIPAARELDISLQFGEPGQRLLPMDPWDSHLRYDWFTNGSDTLSLRTDPPIPTKKREENSYLSKAQRIRLLSNAYLMATIDWCPNKDFKKRYWTQYQRMLRDRRHAVQQWNKQLESAEFTEFLLAVAKAKSDQGKKLGDGLESLAGHDIVIDGLKLGTTSSTTPRLIDLFAASKSPRQTEIDDFHSAVAEVAEADRAAFNRTLCQQLFGGVLRPSHLASTWVVARHDQYTRAKWLLLWISFLGAGLLLNRFRTRLLFVFGFYRNSIGKTFLGDQRKKSLAALDSTKFGLPHLIMLASRLSPSSTHGHYRVESERFALSSIYCGKTDDPDHCYRTSDVYTSADQLPVTIADGTTMSGAAVTPLMTNNPSFSLILSFFGTGLGRWLEYRPQMLKNFSKWKEIVLGILIITCCSAVFVFAHQVLAFTKTASIGVAIGLVFSIYCFVRRNGVLSLITSLAQALLSVNSKGADSRPGNKGGSIGHIADGGFYDYLGATELLRRRCSLVIVSDAGAHLNDDSLKPLASLIEYATAKLGVQILDLDHDAPIDFRRLELSDSRQVHQPFLCARIRYPERPTSTGQGSADEAKDDNIGLLIYCQMAITKNDPLEIQQIRNRFPSFPDEPTSNQFYTDEQVAAYRNLGYHIANRMCSELYRWSTSEIQNSGFRLMNPEEDTAEQRDQINLAGESLTQRQPMMNTIMQRLQTAFRLACYEEISYRDNDIFSEAIWAANEQLAPAAQACFRAIASRCCDVASELPMSATLKDSEFVRETHRICDQWLSTYEKNADLRARYRSAVVSDINSLDDVMDCKSALLFQEIVDQREDQSDAHDDAMTMMMACHLATLAVACHEIHRGRPASVFQVGGREKLIALVTELSQALTSVIASSASEIGTSAKTFVGELMEMKKCTFQEGELQTTISFAQCLVTMWGRLGHDAVRKTRGRQTLGGNTSVKMPAAIKRRINADLKAVQPIVENIRQQGVELAATQVRIWLHESLKDNNIIKVVRALRKGWCVAYFTSDELSDSGNPRKRATKKRTTKKKTVKKRAAK